MNQISQNNRSAILNSKRISILLSALLSIVALSCSPEYANGQTSTIESEPDKTSPNGKIDPAAVRYSSPVETIWEFGLKISSTGNASGISATVPVPMDWPEQTITSSIENLSPNVGRIRYTNPTKETRQASFNVNRLASGETAEALVRFQITKRMIMVPDDPSKLVLAKRVPSKLKQFLKPSPYIESTHKRIREIAAELKDDSLSGWQQVEAIYKWVRDNVEYEFDTEIHSCLDALESKTGDCEELSSLFIAICRAMKIPARAVWIPGHTYPEFYLEDDNKNGHWFPCQAAGGYEFGAMTELKPVLQKGDRFKLAGQSKPVRYVQPTLLAKDASGQLSIEWISRDVSTSDEAPTDELPKSTTSVESGD